MVRSNRSSLSEGKKKRKNAKKTAARRNLSKALKCQHNRQRCERKKKDRLNLSQSLIDEHDLNTDEGNLFHRRSDRTFVTKHMKKLNKDLDFFKCDNDLVKLMGHKIESILWHFCYKCHTRYLGIQGKCWCSKPYVMESRILLVGFCPIVLGNLSLIEQLLIARVHPVIQAYRLIGGQTGYSGHVINFFQDVKGFAKNLPHTVADLKGFVNVCYDKLVYHKDFKIRRNAILQALIFLKNNNKFYRDIEIDYEAIDGLPNENFFHGERKDFVECTSDGDVGEDQVVSTAVPSNCVFGSEDKLKHNLKWPSISSIPINEMTTIGYISQAFPCLFPFGEGDLSEVKGKRLTPRVYFQYLMDYEDGRFANHKIFPFFAFNTVMRWECLSKGTVYLKDHPDLKKMNIEVLKDLLKENEDFLKDVMVYGSNIRGTREFWVSRSCDLQSLRDFLGLPTFYFTVSSADMRWPRLKELILHYLNLSSATDKEYFRYVCEHPKICSDFFYEKFMTFFESIVMGAYEVVDYWYRFEWQMRGSPHVHGVVWMRNGVDVSHLEEKFDEVKEKIIEFYDKLISCETPNVNYVDVGNHPSSIKISDITDAKEDLAALLNSVQLHICSDKCTNNGKSSCKYGFPKPLREHSDLVLNKRKYYEFEGKRNHPRLNKHGVLFVRAMRSNSDLCAILTDSGWRQYVSKYISKGEVKSRTMMEILCFILNSATESTSVKSTVQKTFMAALVERDYSAQEVHHLLSGKKLFGCSRSFVKVNLKNSEWKYHMNLDGNDEIKDNYNHVFFSYSRRPQSMEKVSLLKFVQMFNLDTYSARSRKAIAVVFPRLRCSEKNINFTEIARQLVLLYVPWRNVEELCNDRKDWVSLMDENELSVDHLPYFSKSKRDAVQVDDISDSESELESETPKATIQDDWMLFVGASLGESNDLGLSSNEGECHQNYPWKDHKCSDKDGNAWKKFLSDAKKSGVEHLLRFRDESVTLSDDQKDVLNLVSCHVACIKDGSNSDDFPKLILCQGFAGCGKTLLIGEIECIAVQELGQGSVLIMSFTGSSALHANGQTIHSALRLFFFGKKKDVADLKGESLHLFQEKMKNVQIIVIEEFSMVGCRLLNIINRRCMQMKNNQEPFGGMPVLMFGDLHQLPPVGDTPLYQLNVDPSKTSAYAGSLLFKKLVRTKFLSVHHRQSDPRFVEFLDHLSCGDLTNSDCSYISDRFEKNMDNDDVNSFEPAVHLFQYKTEVKSFNKKKLEELGKPIINIIAENNNNYARCSSDDLAFNLQNELELSIGARIMLRLNLYTEAGLVNGAVGVVVDIVHCDSIYEDRPAYVLVKFDDYYGPTLPDGTVPISRVLVSWDVLDTYCTRYQFPLTLEYGLTIHKSQGLTLSLVVLHFDCAEMTGGVFYVAMSRVREKHHLMICGYAENSPLFKINKANYRSKVEGKEWLLKMAL